MFSSFDFLIRERCPSCKEPGIADVPKGGAYPMRDYEMTFKSFMQLISFEPYRDKVGPFMRMCGLIVLGSVLSV